jgi:hypothetical protein
MIFPFILQKMKSLVLSIIFLLCIATSFSQKGDGDSMEMYHRDSISVTQYFQDKKGKNTLSVKIMNPCGLKKGPYDGALSYIEANLKNKYTSQNISYNYADAQSGLLYFIKDEISINDVEGKKAVFIPFYYCGNWDNDNMVSYLIFYDNKKYVEHIKYYCTDNGKCKLNDHLKCKGMPTALKTFFANTLKTKYKKASDLYKR